VVIQFHIKKIVHIGWANQKVNPKQKKQKKIKITYLPNLLIYLAK
jgi:uncharacterized ubiquitin-like protein YukD